VAAAVGLAGSVLLIAAFGGYLTMAIAKPVRRAAAMAGRIAGGDLNARLPEHGPGEVGALQHTFNTMAASLQHSRAELAASRTRIVTAAEDYAELIADSPVAGVPAEDRAVRGRCPGPARSSGGRRSGQRASRNVTTARTRR
jgi:nitrogen fixation/metabolism regulation signal transduction histidine kinase